ncbi:unnamed protein product [Mytilus coruscus]|uniref:HTH psq-type domain-containing protein n=1 Tax=Mytilus coruscus TaxID=42192 RepID=A0A6J8ACX9_MYTCO|nr:unnamed protein product [Mytilus coruscus]
MAKYKQYTEEQLVTAINKVKTGLISKSKASKLYKIPRKTLSDYILGKSIIGKKGGPKPYLTKSQDSSLANYVKYMSESGFGLTRKVLQTFALSVTQKSCPSVQKPPSKKWCQKFFKETQIILKDTQFPTEISSCCIITRNIDEYFKLLHSTINKLDLQDKPSQIWNADEAGFGKETDQIKQKIISPTGTKTHTDSK